MAERGLTGARKSRGSLTVRWFRRAVPWGTVYLTCDERHPQRFKISSRSVSRPTGARSWRVDWKSGF